MEGNRQTRRGGANMKLFRCEKCGAEFKYIDKVVFRRCEVCNMKMVEVGE